MSTQYLSRIHPPKAAQGILLAMSAILATAASAQPQPVDVDAGAASDQQWLLAFSDEFISSSAGSELRSTLEMPAGVSSLKSAPPGISGNAAAVQTIYMATTGSDANTGSSPATAVASLARVQALVAAGPADRNVEVRIRRGTYVAAQTVWQTYRPGYTISFLPDDYVIGNGASSIAGRPVFQNARASGSNRYITGHWFYACPPNRGRPLSGGGTSGLQFYYLQVQNYANGGISLDGSAGECGGGYQPSSGLGLPSVRGLNGNTIVGMVFTKLGNAHTGGLCNGTVPNPNPDWIRCGYGGIVLTESSNNRIANNQFVDVRNTENSYIHAIYVTHKSSNNRFTGNYVADVSSDPVKVRNSSNYNTFDSNTFVANGWIRRPTQTPSAHYLEEGGPAQCSSYHNRFTNNKLGSVRTSSPRLPDWALHPAGATYPGPAGCPRLPTGETRLTTAGNSY
jgi:hypothetical protein